MLEKPPANECVPERFPSEQEVREQFKALIEGKYTIIDRRTDKNGLYFLQAEATDAAGDRVHYDYMRAGQYGKIFSNETVICAAFFVGETPCGGRVCKIYREGDWFDE